MNVNNVSLEISAVGKKQFPDKNYPEIAFAGRSNVGKSTLINALINRKSLARTSQNPGKTRTINFYNVDDLVYFVDLPGYGYAKTSKSESEKWGAMVEGYLLGRHQLKAIILLIDARHALMPADKQMYDFLRYYEYGMIICATKADKLSRNELSRNISALEKALDYKGILPFSGVTKQGKDELWEKINFAAFDANISAD